MKLQQIGLEELKKIQIEILDVVMDFCDEHKINCWLNGGTLLGAIRHKGYIPWDDDIDLGMLRPDYDKFTELFNQHNSRYKFHCFENDSECLLPFGKVFDTSTILYEPNEKGTKYSINIDIFVIDNAPDDDAIVNKMFRIRDILYLCSLARRLPLFFKPTDKGGFMRSIAVYAFELATRIFPRDYFTRKMLANSKRFINQQTKRAGDFTGMRKAIMDKTKFENTTYAEFEGKKYKVPIAYDEWLKALYGDYMQLPPVEQRVSTHVFKAYKK